MSEVGEERSGARCGQPKPPRKGLYRRFFAWLLSKLQTRYGREVDERKQALLAGLRGTVVEVGAGAGANLGYYADGVELLLVEPNQHAHAYLRQEGERLGVRFAIRGGTAECLDVADGVADHVVVTLVLCSVDEPKAAIAEVLRVLKPGGTFVFLEHVAAPRGSRLRRWQRRLRGFWRLIGDGCTLDRETWRTIEEAGFESCRIERFEADNVPIARPHIAGIATKAARREVGKVAPLG